MCPVGLVPSLVLLEVVPRLLGEVQVYCLAQLVASGGACRVACTSLTSEAGIHCVAGSVMRGSQDVCFTLIELDGRELALARCKRDLHFVSRPVLAPCTLAHRLDERVVGQLRHFD